MKDGLYVVGESHNREAQQHNSYSTSKQVRMQVFGSNAPAIVVPPVPGSLLTHELTDHCTSSNYLYNSSVESIKTLESIKTVFVFCFSSPPVEPRITH